MQYTRIYADAEGESHFEDVDVPLSDFGSVGHLSTTIPVSSIQFRENDADYNWDFHNAPKRQFIILLDGIIEITTSLIDIGTFKKKKKIKVENTKEKCNKTKNITNTKRNS